MRIVVQRCREASVTVDGKVVGQIEQGLLLLVGFTQGDSESEMNYLVDKVVHLRIFDDENGVMNKSVLDVGGSILSVSQFTLYADTRKGRRPSYVNALNGENANFLYQQFNQKLREKVSRVEEGMFGADMKVQLLNDGPVTIILEKEGEIYGK